MIRKRLHCRSCETICDVIVTSSNYDDDDIEIVYCPCCSVEVEELSIEYEDDDE